MDDKSKQIYRTLDKADRMSSEAVFDLLTEGRLDKSGDFTKGCGLTKKQAAVLTAFVFLSKQPEIYKRIFFIEFLDEIIVDKTSGKTAWDQVLDEFEKLPDPKNIAFVIDDLINDLVEKQNKNSLVSFQR